MPIITALIKYGIVGAVLAWALMENSKDKDRTFLFLEKTTAAIQNNTAALYMIKSESCVDFCREASIKPGSSTEATQ